MRDDEACEVKRKCQMISQIKVSKQKSAPARTNETAIEVIVQLVFSPMLHSTRVFFAQETARQPQDVCRTR